MLRDGPIGELLKKGTNAAVVRDVEDSCPIELKKVGKVLLAPAEFELVSPGIVAITELEGLPKCSGRGQTTKSRGGEASKQSPGGVKRV